RIRQRATRNAPIAASLYRRMLAGRLTVTSVPMAGAGSGRKHLARAVNHFSFSFAFAHQGTTTNAPIAANWVSTKASGQRMVFQRRIQEWLVAIAIWGVSVNLVPQADCPCHVHPCARGSPNLARARV